MCVCVREREREREKEWERKNGREWERMGAGREEREKEGIKINIKSESHTNHDNGDVRHKDGAPIIEGSGLADQHAVENEIAKPELNSFSLTSVRRRATSRSIYRCASDNVVGRSQRRGGQQEAYE